MSVRLKKTMLSAVAGSVTAVAVLGITAGPAFAKSDSTLSAPRSAHLRHAFRLTVAVGDDGGARPASARLQVRDARGHFHWYGAWHRLHRTDYSDESYGFTVTEGDRGPVTFRAVITRYATTNAVTVAVR